MEGQNDLLVYRARCCNPIRGEEIIGYVTRGKGVAVHARRCPNVQNLLYEADRRISVEWSKNTADDRGRKKTYPVKVIVFCDDRAGMLKNLTAIISDDGTNIRSVDSRAGKDGEAIVEFIVEAEDVTPPGSNCHRVAHTPRRARCGACQQGMIAVFVHGQP